MFFYDNSSNKLINEHHIRTSTNHYFRAYFPHVGGFKYVLDSSNYLDFDEVSKFINSVEKEEINQRNDKTHTLTLHEIQSLNYRKEIIYTQDIYMHTNILNVYVHKDVNLDVQKIFSYLHLREQSKESTIYIENSLSTALINMKFLKQQFPNDKFLHIHYPALLHLKKCYENKTIGVWNLCALMCEFTDIKCALKNSLVFYVQEVNKYFVIKSNGEINMIIFHSVVGSFYDVLYYEVNEDDKASVIAHLVSEGI